jgi:hypothetical protein
LDVGQNNGVVIIDYQNPASPQIVSIFHVQGQFLNEQFGPLDQKNPDGSNQRVYCHEIFYDQNRLYVAYRDAGMIIIDVTDRANPKQISRYDWVPPYNGGGLGAAHSVIPILPNPDKQPNIVVTTDENFFLSVRLRPCHRHFVARESADSLHLQDASRPGQFRLPIRAMGLPVGSTDNPYAVV